MHHGVSKLWHCTISHAAERPSAGCCATQGITQPDNVALRVVTQSDLDIARHAVAEVLAWRPRDDEGYVVVESAEVVMLDDGDRPVPGVEVRWRQWDDRFGLVMSVTELFDKRLIAGTGRRSAGWFTPELLLALVEPQQHDIRADRTIFRHFP